MLEVYTYNAGKGDCIRLHFAGTHNIFIDSGITRFAPKFRQLCDSVIQSGETLDLLILTHVDDDHIGGFLANLRIFGYRCPFKEVWMNHVGKVFLGDRPLSVIQNDEIYAKLIEQRVCVKTAVKSIKREIAGALINIFWPDTDVLETLDKQYQCDALLAHHNDYHFSLSELAEYPLPDHDISQNNRKSVVFSFSFENHNLLFTGDAWPGDIIKAKGNYDLIKLSHHGSSKNISEDFPKYIRSSNFLICTDGINHPDKQTIAKLEKWYGQINIYSPVSWWDCDYLVEDDMHHKINYYQREGLVIAW
ncbi:MAG: ComEC/Rec2 family competence protein [Erysipelotrichaceae bacterium]